MRKKVRFVPLVMACLLIISVFVGCGEDGNSTYAKQLEGSWSNGQYIETFSNGSYTVKQQPDKLLYSGTYEISDDNTLTLEYYRDSIGANETVVLKYMSLAELQDGEKGWYIDGDSAYLGSISNPYFRVESENQ